MSEEAEKPEAAGGKGELQTDILQDDDTAKRDLRMISRAVREAWPIAPTRRGALIDRMMEIVDKREVAVMTKNGVETLDGPADSNAIAASSVLVRMDGINQDDYWNNDKNERLDEGKLTENHGIMPAIVEHPVRTTG